MSVRLQWWRADPQLVAGPHPPTPAPERCFGRGTRQALTGNEAAAFALRQIRPHVTAVSADTPDRAIADRLNADADFTRDCEVVICQGHGTALTVATAASAGGGRVAVITGGHGFIDGLHAYHNAGALRLPVVALLINRHVGGLLNTGNDHTDVALAAQAPWVQVHARNAQEVYDGLLFAFRVAEDLRLRLPVTVCYDGDDVSHTLEPVYTLDDDAVQAYVGELAPPIDLLDLDNPHALGGLVGPDHALSVYAQIAESMRWAPQVIQEAAQALEAQTGRAFSAVDAYRMDDAEVAVAAMGSVNGTVRSVVDALRGNGVRAGLLTIRQFRPFPAEAIARGLGGPNLRALAVLDQSVDLGQGGTLFQELWAVVARQHTTIGSALPGPVYNVIGGLGGSEISQAAVNGIFGALISEVDAGSSPTAVTGPVDPVRFLDHQAVDEPLVLERPKADPRAPASSSTQIIVMGRGHERLVPAGCYVSRVAIDAGLGAQCRAASQFERRMAPTQLFVKIAAAAIEDRQGIVRPDLVVIFDDSLLESARTVLEAMGPGGVVLVNTRLAPRLVQARIGQPRYRVYTLDADRIALAELGQAELAPPMAAAILAVIHREGRLGPQTDPERIEQAFGRCVPAKGDAVRAGWLRAFQRGWLEVDHEGS